MKVGIYFNYLLLLIRGQGGHFNSLLLLEIYVQKNSRLIFSWYQLFSMCCMVPVDFFLLPIAYNFRVANLEKTKLGKRKEVEPCFHNQWQTVYISL